MGKPLSAAVIGAGIGGLAAALAIANDGHDVSVFEKRTGFGETGAGIQLSPNAIKALKALGIVPPRTSVEPAAVTIRSIRSGRHLAEMPLGPAMRNRYGAPYLVVARSDLHTALLDAVRGRSGIRLLVGRALSEWRDEPDRVELTLSGHGGARADAAFDLVVGADGIGSKVRQASRDEPPRPNGFLAARTVVPTTGLPSCVSLDRTGLWWGRDRHLVHYPIDGGRGVNIVAVLRGQVGDGWSESIDGDRLRAAFAKACPRLQQLLAVPTQWTAWSLAEAKVQAVAGRRVALLGDAAHPILPYFAQGGALALEDAVVLAHALHRHAEPSAALAAYARAREQRARRVQTAARRNGRIFHLGGITAAARNLTLRLRPPRPASLDWLYGWEPPAA